MKRQPIFSRLKAAAATLSRMLFGRSGGSWKWTGNRNLAFVREVGDMTDSNVVMAPVQYIARAAVAAKIVLEDKDGETVNDHPMLALLRKPNPYYSGTLLRSGLKTSFALSGNAYAVIIRNARLKPVQLWYVPHFLIKPAWDVNGEEFITHYEYRPSGQLINLAVEDVIHFRNGIDPENIRLGLSPLGSAVREIFTDDEAAEFSAHILRNMGVPGMVIAPDSDQMIDPGDVQATKDYIRDMFGGARRGEPLVLRGRTMVKPFSFSPKDLDLSSIRDMSEERVCALLGLPAAVVGFGSGMQQTKVGATMKELRQESWEGCMIPMQRLFSEELENQLLVEFETSPDKFRVAYDYSDVRVLRADEEKRSTMICEQVSAGILRVDKAQGILGLEVDDSQSVYLRGMATIEVPAETAISYTTPEPEKAFKSAPRGRELAARLSRVLYSDELRLRSAYAVKLALRFSNFGKRAGELYLEEMEARGEKALGPLDDLVAAEVLAKLLEEITKDSLLGMGPHYLAVASQTIADISAVTGLDLRLTEPIEMRVLQAKGRRQGLIDLSGQTKKSIFDAIEQGRAAGEGVDAIARSIADNVGRGRYQTSKIRAELIARTETKYAQNFSSLATYEASDSFGAVQVLDSQLGSFDDYCDSVNGIIVTFEEAEFLANEEHPNGTRTFIPVFGVPENFNHLPTNVEPNNPGA